MSMFGIPLRGRASLPLRGIILAWMLLFFGIFVGVEIYGHAGCDQHLARATGTSSAVAPANHAGASEEVVGTGDPSDQDGDGGCICIGDCATAGSITLLPARLAGPTTAIAVPVVAVLEAASTAPHRAPIPHLLPYGQAPPLVS